MASESCQDRRKRLLNSLKSYNDLRGKDCIALLLGAGCNSGAVAGCALPRWSDLLRKLSESDEEIDSSQYLKAAGRIQDDMKDLNKGIVERHFRKLALVPTPNMVNAAIETETAYNMAKFVELALESCIADKSGMLNPDSTMGCVIDVCFRRVQNGQRTIVITYNYDDLFESRLRMKLKDNHYDDKTIVCPADTLAGASELICSGKKDIRVGIFYVHGKIPVFDSENGAFSGHVILSQQDYDHLSRNHLEAANQIQYIVQAGVPMVAIGFSFDDFNFDRLRTDLKLSNVDLPAFYSLQYCDKEESCCASCDECVQKKMHDQIRHIQTYNICALPMPKNTIRSSFQALFGI